MLELIDLCPNGWVPADRVAAHFAGTKTYIGGALDAIREFGVVTMRFGPTARVKIGRVELTIVSQRFQTFDDRPFLMTGCRMEDYDIVCLKSMNHFRAYFAPIADGIVAADTPGLRPANLKNATYTQVLRPIYPLDEDAVF